MTKITSIHHLAELAGTDTTIPEAVWLANHLADLGLLDWIGDEVGGTLTATDDEFYTAVTAMCDEFAERWSHAEIVQWLREAIEVNGLDPETFDLDFAATAALERTVTPDDNDGLIADPVHAHAFGTLFDERFFR